MGIGPVDRDMGRLGFGVSVEGGPLASDQLRAVTDAVGERPGTVLWFEDFHAPPPTAGIDAVAGMAAFPIITWEPWHATLESITRGEQDDHLISWAEALAACDSEVGLRLAHEFNGDWYPWTPARGGTHDEYVSAWRHAHDLFREHGATNLVWIWSPNAVSLDPAPLDAWYPGNAYVNVLAVDGYNWGNANRPGEWIEPDRLFSQAVAELRTLDDDKPILIAEVACAENGGSKAEWIADFVAYVDTESVIDGFVWFEHDKETDWRMVSSRASTEAMAAALEKRAVTCEVRL